MSGPAVDVVLVDPALVRAHGRLVALIGVLLERAGVARLPEFAAILQVYADTTSATEPVEGAILRAWAEAVTALSAEPQAQ